jgi:hypothetical protein
MPGGVRATPRGIGRGVVSKEQSAGGTVEGSEGQWDVDAVTRAEVLCAIGEFEGVGIGGTVCVWTVRTRRKDIYRRARTGQTTMPR